MLPSNPPLRLIIPDFPKKEIPFKPKRKKHQKPEAKIQQEIVDYLESRGIFVAVTDSSVGWNYATKKMTKPKISVRGYPDLSLVLDSRFDPKGKGGLAVFLEVKSKYGRLRDSQRETIARLRSAGAIVEVVRSVWDVRRLLDRLENQAKGAALTQAA